MAKENFNDLINKVKSNNQPKTIQKVVPITSKEHEEVQFSFYLEKELLKRIKLKAIEEDKSIKAIINQVLTTYINENKKGN